MVHRPPISTKFGDVRECYCFQCKCAIDAEADDAHLCMECGGMNPRLPKPADPPWQKFAEALLYAFLFAIFIAGFYFGGVGRQAHEVSYLPEVNRGH
jgi:hypothetical protein